LESRRVIDVRFLIAHSLWILGASALLATAAYYNWLAQARGKSRVATFRDAPGWRLSVPLALVMIAAGFLLMASSTALVRVLWSAVLAGALYDLWRQRKAR
jgi:hypothetical protein